MNHPYNQIVLFGDSITQMSFDPSLFGFGANLSSAYQRKMDVLNRGFSGYNTDWGLPIYRQLLPKIEDQHRQAARIELMTIFFGANDAAHLPSFQHVPLDRFKTNLATMIKMVKDPTSPYYNPSLRLVLITQPPLNEPQWKQRCEENGNPMDRSSEQAQIYAAATKQVAQEHDIVVVDLWSKVMAVAAENPNGLTDYLFDGLHLNSNGFKVLFNLLMEAIQTHYPEVHPNNIEMELPGWREFGDFKDLDQMLTFPLLKKTD